MKHTDIRAAVLDALEQHEHGATLFDGRPVVFDEEDFPAIAVYLTDAEYTGEELDADTWRATTAYSKPVSIVISGHLFSD
ncbi:phage minor tail protein [Escherichia coli]|nr:phage minor tail protein [Escherichia coli]